MNDTTKRDDKTESSPPKDEAATPAKGDVPARRPAIRYFEFTLSRELEDALRVTAI